MTTQAKPPAAELRATDLSIEELQALISQAERAEEPGTLSRGDIIYSAEGEHPMPVVAQALTSAGYVYLWSTETGDRIAVNRNMLPNVLRKRRTNGEPMFSPGDPGIDPWIGSTKCLLHPESPDRERYAAMGLPSCRKKTIRNEYNLELHMLRKHKSEWATIKKEREDLEKAEDRAFQRKLAERAFGNSLEPVQEAGDVAVAENLHQTACEGCSRVFQSRTAAGAKNKLRHHKTREHDG